MKKLREEIKYREKEVFYYCAYCWDFFTEPASGAVRNEMVKQRTAKARHTMTDQEFRDRWEQGIQRGERWLEATVRLAREEAKVYGKFISLTINQALRAEK